MEQSQQIRVLSLWQPWATLIALRLKQYETRSWATPYRGTIAIQAAKRQVSPIELSTIALNSMGHLEYNSLQSIEYPLGAIVCLVDLTNCFRMSNAFNPCAIDSRIDISQQSVLERAVGNWAVGRFAWKLDNIIALPEPISYKGSQGLRNLDRSAIELIQQQTGVSVQ